MKNTLKYLTLFVLTIFIYNCREEIELGTENFENVLVVESTLVNQMQFQEVKLTRTSFLESDEEILENNASVKIIDDIGNTYNFSQNTEGIYVSTTTFQAVPDNYYTLFIETSDGKQYKSLETQLTPISQINNLYVEYDDTEEQAQVYVDSDNTNNEAHYFRYEYEETYKIIVPYHSVYNAIVTNVIDNGQEYDIELVLKEEDERICYSTIPSIDIILYTTSQLGNNIIDRFPIRTIGKDNAIIRERYSILVKQYVQSLEAYNYYKTIKELSINENILSENQPGFVTGNIISLNNTNEKVIGFFEVASMSSERIFFNYFDLNITQPDYFYDCEYKADETGLFNLNRNHLKLDYLITGGPGVPNHRYDLYSLLTNFEPFKYYNQVGTITEIVSPLCGDCTSFSSNIQPEFWID